VYRLQLVKRFGETREPRTRLTGKSALWIGLAVLGASVAFVTVQASKGQLVQRPGPMLLAAFTALLVALFLALRKGERARPQGGAMPPMGTRGEPQDDQLFRLLIDSVQDYGIVVLDPKGGVVSWNQGAARLLGYSLGEIASRPFSLFYLPEEIVRGSPEEALAIAAAEGRLEEEGWRVRKDLSCFWANVVTTALRTPDGALCGFGYVIRDFTARRKAEERVRRAKEGAELASLGLESFNYSIAHDLRVPLRAIDGFSRALLQDHQAALPAEAQDYLHRIHGASTRMGQLIDALLDLSRVSQVELRQEPVDLSALANAVLAQLRATQPERKVLAAVQPGLLAQGDSRLLRAVLENLLGNAWKFTGKMPEARLEFGFLAQGNLPSYFVRDNGAGFSMEHAQKLFAPFQRLHAANDFAGTGIGLATVQRIVHRHGGRVWAESQVDRGATFHFTLGQELV